MGIGLDKRRFFATKPHRRNDIDQCFIPDDVTLNNTIKMILLAEPLLFDSIVCVNTVDQVVTLSGYVREAGSRENPDCRSQRDQVCTLGCNQESE